MDTTVKILLDVVVKNGTQSLHILERINNNEDFDLFLNGLVDESCECHNLSIQEITTLDDEGVIVEIYKPAIIKYDFIKVGRRNVELGDIVLIDGIDYVVTPIGDEKVTLYSHRFNKYYFENDQKQNIEEISVRLQEDNVKYDIFKNV